MDAPLTLSQTALKQLIVMTPYAYKAKPERRQALEQNEHLSLNAQFQLYLFKKK